MENSQTHQVHHRAPKAARRQAALRKRNLMMLLTAGFLCSVVVMWTWLSSRSRSRSSPSSKWYDSIPGLDLQQLAPPVRAEALQRMNHESCTCSCKLSLAQCRHTDPTCKISLPVCSEILAELQKPHSPN